MRKFVWVDQKPLKKLLRSFHARKGLCDLTKLAQEALRISES